jgi:hypothetical protein
MSSVAAYEQAGIPARLQPYQFLTKFGRVEAGGLAHGEIISLIVEEEVFGHLLQSPRPGFTCPSFTTRIEVAWSHTFNRGLAFTRFRWFAT